VSKNFKSKFVKVSYVAMRTKINENHGKPTETLREKFLPPRDLEQLATSAELELQIFIT